MGLKVGKSYILYIVDTLYNIYVISLNVKCLKQTHVHTYVAIVHNSIINELINNELIFSCDTQSHYEIRDLQPKELIRRGTNISYILIYIQVKKMKLSYKR